MTFESSLAKRRQELLNELKNINTSKQRKMIAEKQLAIIERDMQRMSIDTPKEDEADKNTLTYPAY